MPSDLHAQKNYKQNCMKLCILYKMNLLVMYWIRIFNVKVTISVDSQFLFQIWAGMWTHYVFDVTFDSFLKDDEDVFFEIFYRSVRRENMSKCNENIRYKMLFMGIIL